jgi:hypothetical protein
LHFVIAFKGLWDIDGFEELLVWDWVFHNVMYFFVIELNCIDL